MAVTMVTRVNTSPAFAPKALCPPMPPRAPDRPPPRPRWTSTSRIKKGGRQCQQQSQKKIHDVTPLLGGHASLAAAAMARKLSAFRLAPPTNAPSMSGWASRSAALSGLTLPP